LFNDNNESKGLHNKPIFIRFIFDPFIQSASMKFFLCVFLILLCSSLDSVGQSVQGGRLSNEVYFLDFSSNSSNRYFVEGVGHFTSLVIKISSDDSFANGSVILGGEEVDLTEDEHATDGQTKLSVQLIVDDPLGKAELFLPGVEGSFQVFVMLAPETSRGAGRQHESFATSLACELPPTVAQSDWREGLSAPSYSRSFTETEHIIIHHSATSNSLSNYTNVVRNIYLYHTQVNGWSDIGYNYLVAPDGTIFNGRDPGAGEQDLVLGAHFCGSNTTTMGICLLGTFTDTDPSDEAMASLMQLSAWKSFKDELDILTTSSHPLNSNLPVIAGHRQGCNTQCPGDRVFQQLPDLRMEVWDMVEACKDPLVADNIIVYPNPSEGDLLIELPQSSTLEDVELVSVRGQKMSVAVVDEGLNGLRATTSQLKPGVYLLRVKLRGELPEVKKIIIN